MANVFYVYEHWRPDKDVCFYVGKGKGRRAHSLKRRSDLHQKIIDKLSKNGMCVEVRLFASGLTEKEALEIEVSRIAHYRERGVNLANRTDGGDGISGYRHTDEIKQRWSEERKGHPPTKGTKGMKFSEETRKKMSERKKGKPPNNKGKVYKKGPLSDEARKNMSDAAKKTAQQEARRQQLIEMGKKGRETRWGKIQ